MAEMKAISENEVMWSNEDELRGIRLTRKVAQQALALMDSYQEPSAEPPKEQPKPADRFTGPHWTVLEADYLQNGVAPKRSQIFSCVLDLRDAILELEKRLFSDESRAGFGSEFGSV